MKKLIVLLCLLISYLASAQWYYGPNEAVNLENTIGYDKQGQKIIAGVATDPTTTSKSGDAGSLLLRTDGSAYLKQDNGNTTGWDEILKLSDSGLFDLVGTATAVMAAHNLAYVHSDIFHSNRVFLDTLTATSFDPLGASTTAYNNAINYADGLASNYDSIGTATSVMSAHNIAYNHTNISHVNRSALDSVTGTNTGDETYSSITTKIGATTYAPYGSGGVSRFKDLTDVSLTSTTTGDYPRFNSVSGKWENTAFPALNFDPLGASTTAYNNAKSYADGLASNYDSIGTATSVMSSHTSTYDHTKIHNALTLGTTGGLSLATQVLSMQAATTAKVGTVQLTDSYTGTSSSIAPTQKALNDVYNSILTGTSAGYSAMAVYDTQDGLTSVNDNAGNSTQVPLVTYRGDSQTGTLSSNTLTINAGTYDIDFCIHFLSATAGYKTLIARIYNGSSYLCNGGEVSLNGSVGSDSSCGKCRQVVASTLALTLRAWTVYRSAANATYIGDNQGQPAPTDKAWIYAQKLR
jgi:hypothetical protein